MTDQHKTDIREALIRAKRDVTLGGELYPESTIIIDSSSIRDSIEMVKRHALGARHIFMLVVVER